jgi:hypothetical protein
MNTPMFGKIVIFGLCLAGSAVLAQQGDRVDLGILQTGAMVSFVRTAEGEWGIEISGAAAPMMRQQKPVQIQVLRPEEDIYELAAGYRTVQQSASDIEACAEITTGENVIFRVQDRWCRNGAVVSMRRRVQVVGNAPGPK